MERGILHCDLDNFFASVSLLDKPELRDKCVAIGGDEAARRGIVLAKNQNAKKLGIKTAETLWQARAKCPDLVIIPPNYHLYMEYSRKTREIYGHYTNLVEPFSIDECWLDVTGSRLLFGSPLEIAERIKREVKEELGITVSIGVSFNKVFAKLGSDMNKPDGITVISKENFKEKIWPLPVNYLLFIGRRTTAKLETMGIKTIGALAQADIDVMLHTFGKNGALMHDYASGLDVSPVVPSEFFEEQKSISKNVTLPRDITKNSDARRILLSIAEDIGRNLREQHKVAKNVGIIVKDCDLFVSEHARQLEVRTQSTMVVADEAYDLFCEFWDWKKPVRMLGIKVYNLVDDDGYEAQIDFEGNVFSEEKQTAVDSRIDGIRRKFGSKTVVRASEIDTAIKPHDDPENLPGFPRIK